MGPERKLYQELKKNTPGIIWNRIENLAGIGMPDCLGYNTNKHFFTVELKVTKSNKIRFSPHQIAFHTTHPKIRFSPHQIAFHTTHPNDTFILAKHHGQGTMILVPGSMIQELLREGFACSSIARGSWSTVLETLLAC